MAERVQCHTLAIEYETLPAWQAAYIQSYGCVCTGDLYGSYRGQLVLGRLHPDMNVVNGVLVIIK